MVLQEESTDLATPSGPMRTYVYRPVAPGRYPALVLFSEIFQRTGPIKRVAALLAGHGFVVAVPEIFHELEPPGTELPSIRDLALKHAINPMTVSKVYTLLEAEGVLERNRGKPMTVAKPKRTESPVAKRLEQLEPHVEQVALAARQLELSEKDVVKALHETWEKTDVESLHRRARPR